MNTPSSDKNNKPKRRGATAVPRDRDLDTAERHSGDMPSAADRNIPDEDYTDQDKPLVAGSSEARALHKRPPPAKGELGVGTAGDAARPSKPGIHNKPIPPRGRL